MKTDEHSPELEGCSLTCSVWLLPCTAWILVVHFCSLVCQGCCMEIQDYNLVVRNVCSLVKQHHSIALQSFNLVMLGFNPVLQEFNLKLHDSRSRFIGPCKSWTDARFGITQFVTPNTHIFRQPGVKNRKLKKYLVLVMWSQTCGKMAKIVRKVILKIIIFKIWTFMG